MNAEIFSDLSFIKITDFTQSSRELAEIIGIPAVLRLVKHFAGHDQIYVPMKVDDECALAKVIGTHALSKLVGEFGGTSVKINREHSVLRLLEQKKIVDMRLRGIKTQEIAERRAVAPEDHIPVFKALRTTFSNRPFLLVQGALLVVALGTGVNGTIGMYLHVHYTCQGNKEFASLIGGTGGTLATLSTFLAIPFGLWISTHLGKKEAAIAGIVIMLAGALSIPWMLSPVFPWLVVGVWIISTIGSQCSSLMYGSMVADICDEDELMTTGQRREGSYAAAGSFLNKMVQVIVLVVSGWMPRLAGYTDFSVEPTFEQLERMKTLLVFANLAGIIPALVCLCFYPLTRQRCAEIRSLLDQRKKG